MSVIDLSKVCGFLRSNEPQERWIWRAKTLMPELKSQWPNNPTPHETRCGRRKIFLPAVMKNDLK
jgi:hypothetical protein